MNLLGVFYVVLHFHTELIVQIGHTIKDLLYLHLGCILVKTYV